jgi:tripartite-type tricarboxylate transporter receptor subunit TctC
MTRTLVAALALGGALGGLLAAPANADYPWQPKEPITIIVPWAAGGATDQVTRITAGELEEILGVSVVVVNQPGASGSIGKRSAWEAEHDGYTWTAGAPKQLGTYRLLDLLDTWVEDWHLYLTVTNVPVIAVNVEAPWQDMGELLAAFEERGSEISVGTAGATSSGHVAMEAIRQVTGIDYRHVSYDGGNPAVIAAVAGEVEVTSQLASEQAEMIRGGRLRPLAVVADRALEIEGVGTIPPITDWTGTIPVVSTHFGVFLPKDVPAEVVATLDAIWEEHISRNEALQRYALERGALFTPVWGDEAQKAVWPEIQGDAWMLYEAGRTVMSPEELDIGRP